MKRVWARATVGTWHCLPPGSAATWRGRQTAICGRVIVPQDTLAHAGVPGEEDGVLAGLVCHLCTQAITTAWLTSRLDRDRLSRKRARTAAWMRQLRRQFAEALEAAQWLSRRREELLLERDELRAILDDALDAIHGEYCPGDSHHDFCAELTERRDALLGREHPSP